MGGVGVPEIPDGKKGGRALWDSCSLGNPCPRSPRRQMGPIRPHNESRRSGASTRFGTPMLVALSARSARAASGAQAAFLRRAGGRIRALPCPLKKDRANRFDQEDTAEGDGYIEAATRQIELALFLEAKLVLPGE